MQLTNQYPSLKGKRVVVTGGASGIGELIVRAFIEQHASVSIIDIDGHNGELLAVALNSGHDKSTPRLVHFFACDVSQHAQLQATILSAHEAMGGIDVLVNNAANDARHSWDSVTPESWSQNLALNCGSQFFAMQAVAKLMIQHNSNNVTTHTKGSIVNLGSVSWMRRRSGMVGYTTSKSAINGMTRTMAQELGPEGIRVNCVVPGAIKTPKQDRLVVTPDLEKHFMDTQALKFRLISQDVAAMVLFLASDDARGCAGQSFIVDAGLS